METLIASTFVGKGSLWLFVDHKLVLENSDSLSMDLQANETYVVHWFVLSSPGDSYSITISAPKEAQFQLTRGVGLSGKDFGAFQFKA